MICNMKLTLNIEPKPQSRPRFARRWNSTTTYEDENMKEWRRRCSNLIAEECWRLQGFPDWAFDKAQEVNSNSQLYKQAGNSVTVNVIAAIAKELK